MNTSLHETKVMPAASFTAVASVAALERLYTERGQSLYGGEAVSQLQHALQSAHAAEQGGAAPALIVAALLHDVGHLLAQQGEQDIANGVDDHHEAIGVTALKHLFGPEVLQPMALHVTAKRYLCAREPGYLQQLSPTSLQSLQLQGGVMSAAEADRFEQRAYFAEAILLRRCDELAKEPEAQTPGLAHFLSIASTLAKNPA
ncbi:HD domain-containing protein [Herbaspirillum lusitanum]|uniref:HD domain-containing protein n=1 Tax=Herbaspirillum lusitanum TaxID=213312 RepID=A0ABW9AFK8_9BURK